MKITLIIFIALNIKLKNEFLSEKFYFRIDEIYRISSLSNNQFVALKNKNLKLSNLQRQFRFIHIISNIYYITLRNINKILGINNNNIIELYDRHKIFNEKKIRWNIIHINGNKFLIQNIFNGKFFEANNNIIQCLNTPNLILNKLDNNDTININFIFDILKLFEINLQTNYYNIIEEEPIDLVIKYIDLYDKNLKRQGINQIKKDFDNEELKYCIRSIFDNIPWIRKIYIIMPNEKVRFYKEIEKIKDKIIYIKDKDVLGFDSANNPAFLFNLFNLEKFGISKNFIYMDDDYFIGKSLKKQDFFYYDEKNKKIFPYIISKIFYQINNTFVLNKYEELFQMKDLFQSHSSKAFWLQTYSSEKYFIDHYKFPLIYTEFTHNAIAQNIDELKDLYKEAQNYEYFNETVFSKERFILTLTQQHFFNLFQLNIKKRKVHTIPWVYIPIENIDKQLMESPLFVINTGGNHNPLLRQSKIQKKYLEKRFPMSNIYEIIKNNNIKDFIKIRQYIHISKICIIIVIIKIKYILIKIL